MNIKENMFLVEGTPIEEEKVLEAQVGEITRGALTIELQVGTTTIQRIAEKLPGYKEGVVQRRREGGQVGPHYTKEFADEVREYYREKFQGVPETGPGVITRGALANELAVASGTIQRIVEELPGYKEGVVQRRGKDGKVGPYYTKEFADEVRKVYREIPAASMDEIVNYALANELAVTSGTIQSIAEKLPGYKEGVVQRRGKTGRADSHYTKEFADEVRKVYREIPEAKHGETTNRALAEEFRIAERTIKRIVEELPGYKEGVVQRRGKTGRADSHYTKEFADEVREYYREKFQGVPETGPGEITKGTLAHELGAADNTIQGIAEKLPGYKEGVVQRRGKDGKVGPYYTKEFADEVRKVYREIPAASPDEITKGTLARELGVADDTIQGIAEILPGYKEGVMQKKGKTGKVRLHYTKEFADEVRKVYREIPEAKHGETTNRALAEEFRIDEGTIKRIVEELPGYKEGVVQRRGKTGRADSHYTKEFADEVREYYREKFQGVPETGPGEITNTALADELGAAPQTTRHFAQELPGYKEGVVQRRGKIGRADSHYTKEFADEVRERYKETRGTRERAKIQEQKLGEFLEATVEGKTTEAQNFRKLLNLFSSSRVVDTLYAYRPDFRGIPVERLRKVISQYLGNFLLTRPPFVVSDLEAATPYLENKNLKEGLYEVVKEACLSFYLKEKKMHPEISDAKIFEKYFGELLNEINKHGGRDLAGVFDRVREYYHAVLNEIKKAAPLVDEVKSGRTFPDIYQSINIKELADKKRLLIADQMGVGKSASAILAKEYLGLKLAVIVAPSNVIETWRSYLSDTQTQGGKQIGYFKQGQAPRVFVVDDLKTLQDLDASPYDYLLISHERLTEKYTEALCKIDYDMLVADEIHKLKNVTGGKRAANFIRLAERIESENGYLALLSGTPVPNKVEDVAMVLKLLYPERFNDTEERYLTAGILRGNITDLRALLMARMQAKNLNEHIEMPALNEVISPVELNEREVMIYELLLEEDEFTPTEKIGLLRRFCLNHELLDVTPDVPQQKAEHLNQLLRNAFSKKNKVLLFVNDYIEGVIRGEHSLLPRLALPPGVLVNVVHGATSSTQRQDIQREFNDSNEKILLVVSGRTADVGIDYSGGEHVIFYNEPWTQADKDQQLARVYRPGLKNPLTVETVLTRGTIEEGIHRYIEMKARAIEKLLRGIPITELEEEVLRMNEAAIDQSLEVNRELADYYFSSFDQLNKIYAHVKQIGEKGFSKFLETHGNLYADCYLNVGGRSYQGNASRLSGTLISNMAEEMKGVASELKILDIASGPEMLKIHSEEKLQGNIYSLDINQYHFDSQNERATVGSFLALPYQEGTFDFANLSLAIHYSQFAPSRGIYERAKIFEEINRVLKLGGRAVLSMMHKLDCKNYDGFMRLMSRFGFSVVPRYSGEVVKGDQFKSRIITLEKILSLKRGAREIISEASTEEVDGLKFIETPGALRNSRKILTEFRIADETVPIRFNQADREMLAEETRVLARGEELKREYGAIEKIPSDVLAQEKFVRMLLNDKYILFKKLEKGTGGGVKIENS